jgi:hypothetical protein
LDQASARSPIQPLPPSVRPPSTGRHTPVTKSLSIKKSTAWATFSGRPACLTMVASMACWRSCSGRSCGNISAIPMPSLLRFHPDRTGLPPEAFGYLSIRQHAQEPHLLFPRHHLRLQRLFGGPRLRPGHRTRNARREPASTGPGGGRHSKAPDGGCPRPRGGEHADHGNTRRARRRQPSITAGDFPIVQGKA